ncbi:hypothetical protein N7536_010390 [Penicillium majusculum]|nr:hypothetical protein N7536_010390 [Penicillium majusculum]
MARSVPGYTTRSATISDKPCTTAIIRAVRPHGEENWCPKTDFDTLCLAFLTLENLTKGSCSIENHGHHRCKICCIDIGTCLK